MTIVFFHSLRTEISTLYCLSAVVSGYSISLNILWFRFAIQLVSFLLRIGLCLLDIVAAD